MLSNPTKRQKKENSLNSKVTDAHKDGQKCTLSHQHSTSSLNAFSKTLLFLSPQRSQKISIIAHLPDYSLPKPRVKARHIKLQPMASNHTKSIKHEITSEWYWLAKITYAVRDNNLLVSPLYKLHVMNHVSSINFQFPSYIHFLAYHSSSSRMPHNNLKQTICFFTPFKYITVPHLQEL